MAIKSKSQLTTDIGASTFTSPQQTILTNIVDSYEDIFPQVTTAQRNLLTPTLGQIVYNTDTDKYEYWNGAVWYGIGQDLATPLVVKVDLTSADILALNTTAIPLVAAPPSGYAILPTSIAYRLTYGSTPYSGVGFICVKCTTKTTSDTFMPIATGVVTASANRSGVTPASTGSGINAIVEADSLELLASSAFTAGDSTLTVWLTYSLIAY